MSMISSYEVLRDIDLRISQLQNSTDRHLGNIRSEFRLYRQESIHYRSGILDRLAKLEAKADKPMIDFQAILGSLWFKVAVLMALGASNKELLELVSASFGK